ncbi:MAG: M1 family metallopeptidase [Longimicrobiales bacterium]
MPRMVSGVVALLVVGVGGGEAAGQGGGHEIHNSGGVLSAEQAAYDVTFYALRLTLDPASRSVRGSASMVAEVVHPLEGIVLDLDTVLVVDSVRLAVDGGAPVRSAFTHVGGRLTVAAGRRVLPGSQVAVETFYGGVPKEAPHTPGSWSDGFVWTETSAGDPWVGVVTVLDGADLWWPAKDHPSDEPDSVSLRFTVPAGLQAVSNGRLRGVTDEPDGATTFHWVVSTPINNYGITVNVAPYVRLRADYTGVTGGAMDVDFWVLPESEAAGRAALPGFLRDLRFLEETLGPYPFRRDGYGVVQTPYLGMEHQSAIAYGSDFSLNEWGFDWLHFHELTHEWWANMVTAGDWKDWWLHESFGSYMEALYAESLQGAEAYHARIPDRPYGFANERPVAPRTTMRTRDIYGGDIYSKGMTVLHTLRWVVGPEALLGALRDMAYPGGAPGHDGCACRSADTDEFRRRAEAVSGRALTWFFDAYLHRAELPRLVTRRDDGLLTLRWDVGGLPFPMPVEVAVDGRVHRVELPAGVATLTVPEGAEVVVDPRQWILMEIVPGD